MKPVVVFRQAKCEGAGYLGTFLDQQQIPWCEVRIDLGADMPVSAHLFSGLVFMGGPMSVNDDLPWIPLALGLIKEAIAADIPVMGHCLGGQLMSKALGATVAMNPVKEIGWGEVMVTSGADAQRWFGDTQQFLSFHWHGETFTLPKGATHLLSSAYCQNQAYSIGKHLAMQCHIEMTQDMVKGWCANGVDEVMAASQSPAVQDMNAIQEALPAKINELNSIARHAYSAWVKGLKT